MAQKELIGKAIEFCGSQRQLADRLGCTQALVSMIFNGHRVSAEIAKGIETETNGLVTAHDLRPDIF